jgi:hypothetical protein
MAATVRLAAKPVVLASADLRLDRVLLARRAVPELWAPAELAGAAAMARQALRAFRVAVAVLAAQVVRRRGVAAAASAAPVVTAAQAARARLGRSRPFQRSARPAVVVASVVPVALQRRASQAPVARAVLRE